MPGTGETAEDAIDPVAVTAVRGLTGSLRLRARLCGGRTILADVSRTAPFAVGPPSRRDPERAQVIVQQVGPGLMPGDDLAIEITVERGARLLVRGQSAAKIYPCPAGVFAEVRTVLTVETGGELAFLPGELISFAGSACRQRTSVRLAGDARFAMTEIVTAGRIAAGERDRYRQLDLRLRIVVDGRTLLIERNHLEPMRRPLTAVGRHSEFAVAATEYRHGHPRRHPDVIEVEAGIGGSGWMDGLEIARVLSSTVQNARVALDRGVFRD